MATLQGICPLLVHKTSIKTLDIFHPIKASLGEIKVYSPALIEPSVYRLFTKCTHSLITIIHTDLVYLTLLFLSNEYIADISIIIKDDQKIRGRTLI